MLFALSTAAIYFWVIKPLVYARDDALQARNNAYVQIGLLAHIDPLTQLQTRRQLIGQLERIVSSCIRHKIYGALFLIDLNEFKSINVLHGIEAGDAVLVEVAKRLDSSIRLEEVLGRLVGDKFVVLIAHLDRDKQNSIDKALLVADKLINAVSAPFDYNGNVLKIAASVGISLIEFERLDSDAIIHKANVALNSVKKSGGKRSIFSE